jgi:MFS family permease
MSVPEPAVSAPTRHRLGKNERRAVVSGTLGSAFEYFDFAIFGALSATLFPTLFFADLGSTGGLLASFATFGVGFIARPLGAMFFGHLGDKVGRLPVLYATLVTMGVCTVVIGLLPTGQGVVVASILVALRFIQGFSLGGETSGNQLMVMEHGRNHRRGLLSSFIIIGSPLSQVMANLILALLTSILSEEQWASWGWRVPFLSSLIIVAIAVFIRLRLEETPAFVAEQDARRAAGVGKESAPASAAKESRGIHVLINQPWRIAQLAITLGGPAFSFYLIAVYGLNSLTKEAGIASNTTFLILMVANAVSVPLCILGGWLSDRTGRKRPFVLGLVGNVVGILIFFLSVPGAHIIPITLGAILALGSVQFVSAIYPSLFAEQFPTRFRYSGSALSFAFSNLFFSAPAPIVAAAISARGGSQAVLWLTLGLLALSIIAIATVKERGHVDLTKFRDVEAATV